MVTIRVTAMLDGLRMLEDKLKNMSAMLKQIAVYFESETRKTLEKGEGRASEWQDLSEKTKQKKIKAKGTAYPILTFTGKLRNSINSTVSNNEAQVFSGVYYGVFHQLGTSKMPARPFLEVIDRDIDFIMQTVTKYLGGD